MYFSTWINLDKLQTNYLFVALFEYCLFYNITLFFCPGLSGRCTGVKIRSHIWVFAGCFPAVCKFKRIAHYQLTLGGEVILCIAIKISTLAAHFTLYKQNELKIHFFTHEFYALVIWFSFLNNMYCLIYYAAFNLKAKN